MLFSWRLAPMGAAVLLAAGCVSYPYETAFSTCDAEAGACYRYCEDFEGTEDYALCHRDCEADANQCFATAYGPYGPGTGYSTAYPAYGPTTWYGRYGSWYPNTGYVFSFSYFDHGYGYYPGRRYGRRHGYRDPYYRDRHRNRRAGDQPRRRDGRRRGDGPPPAAAPRPQPQPKGRPAPPRQSNSNAKRPKGYPTGDIE